MRLLTILALTLMTATTTLLAETPVRHVVSFKFKASTPAEEIQKIESAFSALRSKIPQIQSLEWG